MGSDTDGYETQKEAAAAGSKRKKTHRTQKFRAEWLELAEYKYWLVRDQSDKLMAKCSACHSSLTAEFSAIKAHSKTAKHVKCVAGNFNRFF